MAQAPTERSGKYIEKYTGTYALTNAGGTMFQTAHIPMSFAGSRITGNVDSLRKALKGSTVLSIEVVFSDYPTGSDHTRLTERRLQSAKSNICPHLLDNKAIDIIAVRQKDCSDATSAKKLFHGVVVHYQPLPDSASRARELSEMRKVLDSTPKRSAEKEKTFLANGRPCFRIEPMVEKREDRKTRYQYTEKDGFEQIFDNKEEAQNFSNSRAELRQKICDSIDAAFDTALEAHRAEVRDSKIKDIDKSIFPCQYIQTITIMQGEARNVVDSSFNYMEKGRVVANFKTRKEAEIMENRRRDSIKTYCDSIDASIWTKPPTPSGRSTALDSFVSPYTYSYAYTPPNIVDTTFAAVFRRNPKWTDVAVIADVTGSMSPYNAKMLQWLKLQSGDARIRFFSFFNDGDMTPDNKKVIGKTGGIYNGKSNEYDEVEKLMTKAMMAGCGGDGPENNIEALLRTAEECPDCKEFVMVADALAPVKDISLLAKIKKPVRIILCGTQWAIHPDYLNLALATGGSIHTIEQDIENLARLREGEKITIDGKEFVLQSGKFVPVYRL